MKNKIIVNIHQIKAAGKTLEGILHREYGKGVCFIGKLPPKSQHILYKDYPKKLQNNAKLDKSKIKLITGHVFFGTFDNLYDNPVYITLLRNPIERAISFYYYCLRDDNLDVCKFIKKNSLSLDNFLRLSFDEIQNLKIKMHVKEELYLILHNGQSRLISGDTKFEFEQETLIKKSIQNIEKKFIAIGITDKFKQSMILIGYRLGWHFPIMYKNTNITPKISKNQNISEQTKEVFTAQNSADIRIYDIYYKKLNVDIGKIPLLHFKMILIDCRNFIFNQYIKLKMIIK